MGRRVSKPQASRTSRQYAALSVNCVAVCNRSTVTVVAEPHASKREVRHVVRLTESAELRNARVATDVSR